jgi:hypothetical protein
MMLSAGLFPRATNVNCCPELCLLIKDEFGRYHWRGHQQKLCGWLEPDLLYFKGSKFIRRLFIFVVIYRLLKTGLDAVRVGG